MEYLVTGGYGFIGSSVVRRLVHEGKAVRIIDNLSTGRPGNLDGVRGRVEMIEGDIRDPDAVRAAVRGCRAVFHAAAVPSVVRSIRDPVLTNDVNVAGTLGLLVAARDAGVRRFVFSSSSSVYGDSPSLPKREDMVPMPLSPYAAQKLAGEHYCRIFTREFGLPTFSLRYFNVYGPRQDPKSDYAAVVPAFISAVLAGRSPAIHGDGGQTRDFTFVEDVVEAALRCCCGGEEGAGEVFNVAPGSRTSVNALFEAVCEACGARVSPRREPPRPGDVRDSQADTSKARRVLGWESRVTLQEGLRRTVDWFRNEGLQDSR